MHELRAARRRTLDNIRSFSLSAWQKALEWGVLAGKHGKEERKEEKQEGNKGMRRKARKRRLHDNETRG